MIRYPTNDEYPFGSVIYVKASLTGDAPCHVSNLKHEHDAFRQESTADEWFTESQFESYRRLRDHIILNSVRVGKEKGKKQLKDLLVEIFTAK